MTIWKRTADRLARELSGYVGGAAGGAELQVVGYRGFGTPHEVWLSGRVLRGRAIASAQAGDPWWRNLANTYKRMESDEVPGARVRVRIGDASVETLTGTEGFFRAFVKLEQTLTGSDWHPVDIDLLDAGGRTRVTGHTHVLTPDQRARFGVISDIDDTVVRTDATNFLRMMRGVLFTNAHTRLPFEGVAAFYQALHRGGSGDGSNPFFYVSSSPWNLYDLLLDFLAHRDIPIGPLLLRDWGISSASVPFGHRDHKLTSIRQVLDTYPALPFLLIGDSGQKDPEIYAEVVASYPDRILGVYIRDVSLNPLRKAAIDTLAQKVHEAGSTLVLVEDTVAAARHAAQQGWISAGSVDGVREERTRDHGPGAPPAEHPAVVID